MTAYAVHLSDLAALPEMHPIRFVMGPVLTNETINLGSRFDAVGLRLDHPDPERLAAVMSVAAAQPLPGVGYTIRFYSYGGVAWKRHYPSEVW